MDHWVAGLHIRQFYHTCGLVHRLFQLLKYRLITSDGVRFGPGPSSSYNQLRGHTMLLHGIFPPITTPFYPDGKIYFRKLEQNVEHYSRTPAVGIVVRSEERRVGKE